MEGYIFINNEGQYAVETNSVGFGAGKRYIDWTPTLDRATIFRTVTPWNNMENGEHCNELRHMQPLQAMSARKVTIGVWK